MVACLNPLFSAVFVSKYDLSCYRHVQWFLCMCLTCRGECVCVIPLEDAFCWHADLKTTFKRKNRFMAWRLFPRGNAAAGGFCSVPPSGGRPSCSGTHGKVCSSLRTCCQNQSESITTNTTVHWSRKNSCHLFASESRIFAKIKLCVFYFCLLQHFVSKVSKSTFTCIYIFVSC